MTGVTCLMLHCVPYVPVKRVAAKVPEKLANVLGVVSNLQFCFDFVVFAPGRPPRSYDDTDE